MKSGVNIHEVFCGSTNRYRVEDRSKYQVQIDIWGIPAIPIMAFIKMRDFLQKVWNLITQKEQSKKELSDFFEIDMEA